MKRVTDTAMDIAMVTTVTRTTLALKRTVTLPSTKIGPIKERAND